MDLEKQVNLWISQGKIKQIHPPKNQIDILMKKARKDLVVAKKILSIDSEAAYTIAYGSILKSARALLFSKGYRTDDGDQHFTTVEFCRLTMPPKYSDIIKKFNQMRRNRNKLTYDPFDLGDISDFDAGQAVQSASEFIKIVDGLL